jgi:hypothetical protein
MHSACNMMGSRGRSKRMEINRGVSSGLGWELSVSVLSTAKRVVTKLRSGRRGRVLTKFLDPGELEDHLHTFAWYRSRFHHLGRCHRV